MFHFKEEPKEDLHKEIAELEQQLVNELESMTDPIAVKTTLGNMNLLSVLKKRYYDEVGHQ